MPTIGEGVGEHEARQASSLALKQFALGAELETALRAYLELLSARALARSA